MATIISLVYFVIYLIFRSIFTGIQRFYWCLHGLEHGPNGNPYRLMEILYRKKRDIEEFGIPIDCISVHEKFGPVSLLEDK